MPLDLTPAAQRLLEQAEERRFRKLAHDERLAHGALAIAFLLAAGALATFAPAERELALTPALALTLAFALSAFAEFPSGAGYAVPAQLVFVPMLLLLPTPLVPLLVAAALVLSSSVQALRGRVARERVLLSLADARFAVAPALVLVLAGAQEPAWEHWPAYLLALGAQFAADAILSVASVRAALGVRPRELVPELLATYRVDALLAPVGLLAAFAGAEEPLAALLVTPLVGFFLLFAGEREERVRQALELSRTYKGTAQLLHDVIEEADEYTGRHTEDVVRLATQVASSLGVDEETRRATEFGALLHDVGKISIPEPILHKPGPLTEAEWAVMRRHTVVGERMLDRVGGLLRDVGRVVRASHERWDGRGYPDGLAREAIPLPARIVAACDTYSAMTSDRPYRRALPHREAVHNLHLAAGSQLDPGVVAVLVRLVVEEEEQVRAQGARASLARVPAA